MYDLNTDMDNKGEKYYPDPTWQSGVTCKAGMLVCVHCKH